MNPERLRQLYRLATATRADLGPCMLEPEEMLAVLQGTATRADRERVLTTIATHPACKEEFDLLRAVVLAGAPPRRAWFPAPWALAAMLLVGAGLGALVLLHGSAAAPVLRGRTEGVTLVAPRGAIATGPPVTFVWRAVPEAWSYDLTVVDGAGEFLWRGSTSDTTLRPADGLRVGTAALQWWVVARLPDGRSLRSATADARWP